ncbi:Protoheme IX farnesyltransferase, mitochondrial [Cadophora gregata]|uniref:Protoheme IX farnesyltransferase, mitochondrial n=1 Tax=Cadophora gregata TaxID=51156 RepID=UPI0026DBCD34|nr:Protoheme IX farnesyltransferase, mitochondrial [Cadophora gregata]KAK0102657.1 Protoheme IX farnesyltransferase, mitochondrial [Cadophora gregata]KAK0104313.1 Protoheme IX farnesyltransferase, mitochondrial [Cadophora gregata f. sp. sojae]
MIIRSPPASAFRSNGLGTVCLSCLLSTAKPARRAVTRSFSQKSNVKAALAAAGTTTKLRAGYFSGNALLEKARLSTKRGALTASISESSPIAAGNEASKAPTTNSPPQPTSTQDLPHRRRQAARRAAKEADLVLPPNASSNLSTSAANAPSNSIRRLIPVLLSLSKPRLSVLVVLTACASYSLYPVPELLLPSATDTPSLSPLTLLFLTSGTALCAASANALNMLYEPKWDAMMARTRNRPLVRGLISTRGAAIFAILAGIGGTTALYFGVNPTVSFLGALNIALYAGVYTPLKRISVLNTWVGAIVGGIPPLMGWAAAAGQSATHGDWQELLLGEQNIGGWLLAALLVAWQFAHFMPLSWSIRDEYKNAGYRMLAWVNPARNGRVALRYSLLFFPICIGLCYYNVTEWSFAVASTPVNIYLLRGAIQFWKLEGQKGSARGLFWASVWHLPVVMILALAEKKGMWQRVWRSVMGVPDLDDEEEEDYLEEDEEEAVLSANESKVSLEARRTAIAVHGR